MTLNDVAKHAGVALDTARKALRGDPTVRPYIREIVVKAASDLDYHPNLVARALREQALRLVPITIIDLANPFFGSLARDLSRQLGAAGLEPALCLEVDHLMRVARSLSACASIIAYGHDDQVVTELSRIQKVVTIGRQAPSVGIDNTGNIRIDFLSAYRRAAEVVLAEGRRRVAICSGWMADWGRGGQSSGKFEAVYALLAEHGIAPVRCGETAFFGDVACFVDHLASRPGSVDAVFLDNDLQAGVLLGELIGRGVRVPDDIRIVGCDATHTLCGTWSIRVDTAVLAEQAVDVLRMLLDGAAHVPERVYMPVPVDHTGRVLAGVAS